MQVLEGKLVEGSGGLNVGEGGLEVGELLLDGLGGFLGVGQSLGFKSLNGLELLGDVVGDGREALVGGLNLVDNVLVLQGGAVVGKVNLSGLSTKIHQLLASLVVSLAEGLERGNGRASESEGGDNLGPVDLGGSALEESGLENAKLTIENTRTYGNSRHDGELGGEVERED